MLLLATLLACASETGLVDGANSDTSDTDALVDPSTHDADHDGTVDALDCAPYDTEIHPGAVEYCNGVDDDCDGERDEGFDTDGDGFMDIRACYAMEGEWDCDDTTAAIYPGADEICDGLDNDCDGNQDDVDRDDDGWTECEDCDDSDPFTFDGAPEACDGVDNNCDGTVDELWDADGDGHSPCAGDCDDDDDSVHPGAIERCDGVDQDCDDLVDEDFDLDLDGQSTCAGDCDDTNAAIYLDAEEICDGYDNDCDPATPEDIDSDGDGLSICDGDCDDTSAAAFPGGTEACDGVDNDCNGYFDELTTCWACTESAPYLLCDTAAEWTTAAQVCEGLGGVLAKISSTTENTTVATFTVTPTWIGANDLAVEDTWVWADGSSVSYDAWGLGEPDGGDSSDCAITNTSGRRGEWSDTRCSTEYQFLCEL